MARVLLAAAMMAAVGANATHATELRYRSTRQVAAKSVYIVLAECMAVETRAVEKFGNNLFTFSDFRIEETIAGGLEPEFTLRLFGGSQGNVVIDAPMVPRFQPGERVVLLLGEKNKDGYPIVSLQGVFRVRDANQGRGVIETPITELTIFNAAEGAPYAEPPQTITVDDFVYSLKHDESLKRDESSRAVPASSSKTSSEAS